MRTSCLTCSNHTWGILRNKIMVSVNHLRKFGAILAHTEGDRASVSVRYFSRSDRCTHTVCSDVTAGLEPGRCPENESRDHVS